MSQADVTAAGAGPAVGSAEERRRIGATCRRQRDEAARMRAEAQALVEAARATVDELRPFLEAPRQ